MTCLRTDVTLLERDDESPRSVKLVTQGVGRVVRRLMTTASGRVARLAVLFAAAFGAMVMASADGPDSTAVAMALPQLAEVGWAADSDKAGVEGPAESVAASANPLSYSIFTRYGTSQSSCAGAAHKLTNATIGVPALVNVDDSLLPDLSVTLVVVPNPSGGAPTVELLVNRLTLTAIRVQVEVVVAPDQQAPGRVGFGYDSCEEGAPSVFSATLLGTDTSVSLATAAVVGPAALRVFASDFTDVAGVRTNPRTVSARFAPMTPAVTMKIDTLGPEAYHARLRTGGATNVDLTYSDVDGASRTDVGAKLHTMPGNVDVDLSPTKLEYVAAKPLGQPLQHPIDLVDVTITTAAAGERTTTMRAMLEQVPATARLTRTSETAVNFTTPAAPIGAATVSYSAITPGTPAPALTPVGNQYLLAHVTDSLVAAQVRVLGLRHAAIDSGNPLGGTTADGQADQIPMIVDLTHTAGPFHIDAAVTQANVAPEPPGVTTRRVTGQVLDLPAKARVTYGAKTQSYTYDGSAVIGEMRIDMTSSNPFIDDATAAHLTIRDFPTGLSGRLDELGKTFTTKVGQGSIGLVDLQATSGPDLRLPDGTHGVRVEDHDGAYTAHARVGGLRRATVGWGTTQLVDVDRTAGPFEVHADIDDPDTAVGGKPATDLKADIVITDLPGKARFEYTPGTELECPTQPCGETPTLLTFAGDANVAMLDLDVVSARPIIPSATLGNIGATELHVLLKNIPAAPASDPRIDASLRLALDGTAQKMTADVADSAAEFVIEAEACSVDVCGHEIDTDMLPRDNPRTSDGLWLADHTASYHLFTRISGLTSLHIGWADQVKLVAAKTPGPFDIVVLEDKKIRIISDVFTSFPARTSVAIRDLPGTVDITYTKKSQAIDYHGSGTIGRIEAWHRVQRVLFGTQILNALAGRATEAHLKVTNLSEDVFLTFDFGAVGDKVELKTGDGSIGKVELELLSDAGLLPALGNTPTMSEGFDGLEFWDLNDFDANHIEPVDDGYAIVVRATGPKSFVYRTEVAVDPDEENTYRYVDLRRDSPTNLWVQIFKPDSTKAPLPLEGMAQPYKVQALHVDYANAPATMGFMFGDRKQNPDKDRTFLLTYYGSTPGGQVEFFTNAGKNPDGFASVNLGSMPGAGGTPDAPDLDVCVAGNNMYCSPVDKPDNTTEEFSAYAKVSAPITVNVEYRQDSGRRIKLQDLFIQKGITLSHETVTSGVNSHRVFVDTSTGFVNGRVHITQKNIITGNLDTWIEAVLPSGLFAHSRYVDIENEGTGFHHGFMHCPSGTVITADSWGIDFDLTDDLCGS